MLSELENRLIRNGFHCVERKRFLEECQKNPKMNNKFRPRFAYRTSKWTVITDNLDHPFWTIQKKTAGNVLWYADLPTDVGVDALIDFLRVA